MIKEPLILSEAEAIGSLFLRVLTHIKETLSSEDIKKLDQSSTCLTPAELRKIIAIITW